MKLSIIIPCYNEEQTIDNLVENLLKIEFPIECEVIVVDDGSYKNHRELLRKKIDEGMIKFIRLKKNQGKGVAIRIGLKYATGNLYIVQDADFEYFPTDIPKLLKPIINKESQVVYGSRFIEIPENMTKSHYLANKILTKITNFLYKSDLTDMETGYKLFSKDVIAKFKLDTREFEFEPEITAKILLNGFKIKEVPIVYRYRKFGVAKINWMDGLEGLLILLRLRFCPDSKLVQWIYNSYKYHLKKIIYRLTRFIARSIHMRRI